MIGVAQIQPGQQLNGKDTAVRLRTGPCVGKFQGMEAHLSPLLGRPQLAPDLARSLTHRQVPAQDGCHLCRQSRRLAQAPRNGVAGRWVHQIGRCTKGCHWLVSQGQGSSDGNVRPLLLNRMLHLNRHKKPVSIHACSGCESLLLTPLKRNAFSRLSERRL